MAGDVAAAERLAEKIRGRAVHLERLAAGEKKKVFRTLDRLLGDLIIRLRDADLGGKPLTARQRRRLEKLFRDVEATIRAGYGDISGQMNATLASLAEIESVWVAKSMNSIIGVDLVDVGLTSEQIVAAASDVLIEGAPSEEWWSRQADKMLQGFKDQVRTGWLQGETNEQLLRRLQDGVDADGNPIFDISKGTKRGAEAVIRTSVQAVASDARNRVYQANPDVIKGIVWISTLDSRTTPGCCARDGLRWDLQGNPVGHDMKLIGPPAHWNCRSSTTPWLKSWRELGVDMDEIPESTRASMDGQVPAGITFDGWLKKKESESPGFIAEMFGPGRARLYKAGKIGLRDMVDQTGRPLTLEELKNL